ncbi:MAG: flavin reductase family protein [Candidatus Methylomirabilia bacterium]
MAIGPDEFRHALSHFASGVTVITTWDSKGHPTGLTASAVTSVSLNPPLLLVCVDHQAESYAALEAAGSFAVNILAADQEALSRRFADEIPTLLPPAGHTDAEIDQVMIAGCECFAT